MSDTADLSGGDATTEAPSTTALAVQEGAERDTDERSLNAGEDGPNTYAWDVGIAP